MGGAASLRVDLLSPIPVYLFYTTAVADPAGAMSFYADIYGHDRALERALEPAAPRSR
jgi:murein L,D-transpeptidase YcbB/YkuD